jgi:hypothetical protein
MEFEFLSATARHFVTCLSSNIVRAIESRRMRWAGHIASLRHDKYGHLMGAGHLEHLDVVGKIILKWMLGKWVVRLWTRFIWLRIDSNRGCCERGDEPSGLTKGTGFLSGRLYFQLYGSCSVILLNGGG